MLSPSGFMNKSLDYKEETTHRKAKGRKAWEKHKRAIEYLKKYSAPKRQHINSL
jgi:hypothetical protein